MGGACFPRAPTPRAALVVAFVAASSLVAVLTPAWEANDEPDHVANVETLASGHWYRIDAPGARLEAHQAPAYYLLLAGVQKAIGLPVRQPNPPLMASQPGFRPYLFQHAIAIDGDDQRALAPFRLIGVLLGAMTVLLTAAAARRVSRDPWTPVVAAAFVAFVPKFVFLSGVVNNDNLSNTLGALATLVALAALGTGATATSRGRLGWAAALGAVLGLLVLSKLTAATMALALALTVLYVARRRAEAIRLLAVAGLAALAVCGWWLVQNQVRYGDPLASEATRDHLQALFPPILAVPPLGEAILSTTPRNVFRSFWYISGYNQFVWRSWVPYAVLWLGLAGSLVGLVRRRVSLTGPAGSLPVLWLAVAGGVGAIWTLGVQTTTTQARVGFFALPALGILFALGLERWRLHPAARFLLPLGGLLLTFVAIRRDIVGYYPR